MLRPKLEVYLNLTKLTLRFAFTYIL